MSQPVTILLSDEQRNDLTRLTRRGIASARTLTRARILLLADKSQDKGQTYQQIARALTVSLPTISQVCRRFDRGGIGEALTEKPRPGKVPKITGEVEAQLVMLACSDPPEGKARWTMQLLADRLVELHLVDSISDSAICERLKKTRSSPGR
jgi:putative transposase